MLMLPRLRTRGSLMSSFSDSARWRWPSAEVRLKMARRPRKEDERVGVTSLAERIGRGVPKSWPRRFTHGDDDLITDMELRGTVVENGEGDTLGIAAG